MAQLEPKHMTRKALALAVLETVSGAKRENKWNLLGRPYQRGNLEICLGQKFEKEERSRVAQVFDGLVRANLLASDYGDLGDPGGWVELTPKGERALERRALDELDVALMAIAEKLVDLREGAWEALEAGHGDSLRQAADSGRELIDQTLKHVAPDADVEKASWFERDDDSRSGVTRYQRARLCMEERLREHCDATCRLLVAATDLLAKFKHSRKDLGRAEVEDALRAGEISLRAILGLKTEESWN